MVLYGCDFIPRSYECIWNLVLQYSLHFVTMPWPALIWKKCVNNFVLSNLLTCVFDLEKNLSTIPSLNCSLLICRTQFTVLYEAHSCEVCCIPGLLNICLFIKIPFFWTSAHSSQSHFNSPPDFDILCMFSMFSGDCAMDEWSPFSPCDCANHIKTRTREVLHQPLPSGAPCEPLNQTVPCECPHYRLDIGEFTSCIMQRGSQEECGAGEMTFQGQTIVCITSFSWTWPHSSMHVHMTFIIQCH